MPGLGPRGALSDRGRGVRALSTAVQAAAEIHQLTGALDQGRQHVRRKRIDRQSAGMAFRRRAAAPLRVDTGVVSDGIMPPIALTWSSIFLVSAVLRRSPITIPAGRDAISSSAPARSA